MTRIQRLLGQPSRLSPAPALIFLALAMGAVLFAFQPEPAPVPEPIPAPAPAPDPAPIPDPVPQDNPSPQQPKPSLIERVLARDKTPYDKWLNQEVARIITADEHAAFRSLATDDERQQFIEQFWLRRDPTPNTPANEYKDEYYRRIAWSNDRFTEPGSPGWTTDRGMIYIRFGPPDEREEHPADPSTYANEKWRYRYLEGIGTDVVIGFVDEASIGIYRMSWDDKVRAALQRNQGTLFERLRVLRDLSLRYGREQ